MVAKNLQKIGTVRILNIAIKHYSKKSFVIQVKLWGKEHDRRIELIDKTINTNDRVFVIGELYQSKYRGKEELIIKGDRIININLRREK